MKKLILFLLLLPFFANGQSWVNGSIQKLSTSDSVRALVSGVSIPLAKYADLPFVPPGITDSLLKKANRDMSNVASGAILKSKVDTSSTGIQTVSNFFPRGDTRWLRSSIAASTYLPLSGGTLTGGLLGTTGYFIGNFRIGNNTNQELRFGTSTSWGYILKPDGDNFKIYDSSNTDFINLFYNGGSGNQYISLRNTIFTGNITSNSLGGSGNVIIGASNTGLLGKISIGSGLSLVSGVLSATGGSSGSVTTPGMTAGRIVVANSSSDIGTTTALTLSGSDLQISGSATASSFSGAGTGLTGTASSLTSGNSTGWNLKTFDYGPVGNPTKFITSDDASTTRWGESPLATVRSALGIGTGATLTNSVSGNSGTATSLQTARTINGTPFNGTTDINIGTTVGQSFIGLTNPSAITFPRINANNTVSSLSAADFRTAIGAGTGEGTVTSVSSGNGMSFTSITSSGSVSLGTPTTLTPSTTNAVTSSSHTHAIAGFAPLSGANFTGSISATNLSGTNTGDNAVNATSNAYADSRVQNSLAATTSHAPSVTAVNTALDLKANLSGATFTGAINGTTATFSGDVTANSDRRLKRDIRRLKNVSGSLRALGAYFYKMKGSNSDKIGLIAQQVEKYYPQLVITDSKGIKSVNYQAFTAVLLQGWKELDDRVTKLENK